MKILLVFVLRSSFLKTDCLLVYLR